MQEKQGQEDAKDASLVSLVADLVVWAKTRGDLSWERQKDGSFSAGFTVNGRRVEVEKTSAGLNVNFPSSRVVPGEVEGKPRRKR
ncbi:hypothetical protein ACLGI4_15915 [Streptomyces sp. HMX112]|uniref:hypothetical protein n=1 Tax=Streptomyces sp. HMX112 TaxID=3390850 RepID=UPI003A80BC34